MTTTGGHTVDHILDGAEALLDARRYEAALDVAAKALTVEPGNRAHTVACRALMGLGRHDHAVQAAQQAVRLDPTSAYTFRLLSLALLRETDARKGRHTDDAVTAAREAVRLAPHDPYGYTTLAEALSKTGRVADADAAVRQAIAIAPASADVWVTASLVGIRARNWYAAEKAARRALAIDPDNYSATNNLGVALDRQGYWPLAAVAYLDAARNDPRAITARNNVEAVGFKYLSTYAPLLLLPLLVVAPAFFAARVALAAWLSKRPARLKPLARRLGLRIAGSKRRQRRFEKHNAHVQLAMANLATTASWSSLADRRRASNGVLGVGGGGFLAIGLMSFAAAFSGADQGGGLTPGLIGVAFIACGTLLLNRLRRRRRLA